MVVRVPLTAAEPRAAALPEAAETWTELFWQSWAGYSQGFALSLWFLKGKPYRLMLMPSELLPWMLPAPLLLIVQEAPSAISALWVSGQVILVCVELGV